MNHGLLTFESSPGKTEQSRVLHLHGPVIYPNLAPLQEELRNHPKDTTILDLTDVAYMDSAGMGCILNFYVSCMKSSRTVIVSGLSYHVVELFKLTKADLLIAITDSVGDAEEQAANQSSQ
jgi:anti-anti-sigma factor